MARTLTCECGHVLTGKDDDELLRLGREHVKQVHPGMSVTDEQLRELIRKQARNV